MCYSCLLNLSLNRRDLLNPFRFELVRSAANADGRANSSAEANGSLHNSTKSVFDGEPFSLCEHAQLVKTKPMPQGSSMKSGIAVLETHAHLMRSIDDTTQLMRRCTIVALCMIDIVWMYYILWVSLATRTFPPIYRSSFRICYE